MRVINVCYCCWLELLYIAVVGNVCIRLLCEVSRKYTDKITGAHREKNCIPRKKHTHTHTAIKFYTRNNMKHAHGKRKNRVFIKIGKVKTTETVQPGIHGHLNRRFNTSKHLEAFALRSVGYK